MAEDEKKETRDEASEQDQAQDEGAMPAGPAAEEGTFPSQAAGEEPSSASAAGEASESDDTAPAEESTAPAAGEKAEEPEAEEQPAEPSPEDELPWKERRRLAKSRRPRKPRPRRSAEERKAERAGARKGKAGLRRKERAAKKGKKVAGTGTPPAERSSVAAKVRQGVVVSDRAEKSITVRVDIVRRHPTYEKVIRRSRTLHAHDERNEAGEGDVVRVVETRALSKTKRWRLVEVLEKAK
jgi:small subunit ribosomal protein S17